MMLPRQLPVCFPAFNAAKKPRAELNKNFEWYRAILCTRPSVTMKTVYSLSIFFFSFFFSHTQPTFQEFSAQSYYLRAHVNRVVQLLWPRESMKKTRVIFHDNRTFKYAEKLYPRTYILTCVKLFISSIGSGNTVPALTVAVIIASDPDYKSKRRPALVNARGERTHSPPPLLPTVSTDKRHPQ